MYRTALFSACVAAASAFAPTTVLPSAGTLRFLLVLFAAAVPAKCESAPEIPCCSMAAHLWCVSVQGAQRLPPLAPPCSCSAMAKSRARVSSRSPPWAAPTLPSSTVRHRASFLCALMLWRQNRVPIGRAGDNHVAPSAPRVRTWLWHSG
jgi:hypothetical protein